MTKKTNGLFGILFEALKLYFSQFIKFSKYMTFPVMGQFLGLVIVFYSVYLYSNFLPSLIKKYSVMDNFTILILCSVLVTLPGLILLLKAFWEYLIAYGAINSMFENLSKSGKLYDFDAHTELIKRRSLSFICLWTLVGIFSIFAICPLLWVPCGILAVFFTLIFQVFVFDPDLSAIACFKKSFYLIKGHFASTFFLLAIIGGLTYILIPQLVLKLFEIANLIESLQTLILPLVNQLPFDTIENFFANYNIKLNLEPEMSKLIITQVIATILIQYTLPLRSITCCVLYKNLNKNENHADNKKRKNIKKLSKKQPSEVLMEKSHQKFKTKKLDRNILRRAMEKESNEDE